MDILRSGTAGHPTVIQGNGATITGGAYALMFTTKNYVDVYNLNCIDQTVQSVNITGSSYLNFNNVVAESDANPGVFNDCWKTKNSHHLTFTDCEAGPCLGADTCDGFEDWDDEDITYNNCIAHGFQNGAELLNNGHGFETYAQGVGEICKRVTYNNCHAYDCRVGFSSEGGPLSAAHEDIKALNCTTATIDLYDASGIDGATLYVTADTLTSRNGSVTEL